MVESINWVVCLSMDDLYLMWYGNELLSLLIMVWDPVTFQGNSESRTDASPKFSQGKQLQKIMNSTLKTHSVWKLPKKVSFSIASQASSLQFEFQWTFVHSYCKCSSLRSQCWRRHFGWFSNTVICRDFWVPTKMIKNKRIHHCCMGPPGALGELGITSLLFMSSSSQHNSITK